MVSRAKPASVAAGVADGSTGSRSLQGQGFAGSGAVRVGDSDCVAGSSLQCEHFAGIGVSARTGFAWLITAIIAQQHSHGPAALARAAMTASAKRNG